MAPIEQTAQERLRWSSVKWEKYRGRDVIPLWIADMDFPVAPAISQAVMAQVSAGSLGYMQPPRELPGDLVRYYAERYGWAIEPEWIVWLPGLVLGLNLAVRTCCEATGSALTFSPVYPPFLGAASQQGRRTLNVPLVLDDDALSQGTLRYRIDFSQLEAALAPDTTLLLLCHPHNPVGSLFSAEELAGLADFCLRHDLYVCSDEVHCDLILDEPADGIVDGMADSTTAHVPFARVLADRSSDRERAMARTITLHGPGKVFNLAGLGIAWAIIPDTGLRRRFRAAMQRLVPEPCGVGYTALHAALREGEPWRQDLLAQLRRNRDKVSAALDAIGLPHSHPAATYLTWIDARALLPRVGNVAQWLETKGVGLSDGADFGAPGFLRLNFATTSAVLDEALRRLQGAVVALR